MAFASILGGDCQIHGTAKSSTRQLWDKPEDDTQEWQAEFLSNPERL